jgi:hypothetical protein
MTRARYPVQGRSPWQASQTVVTGQSRLDNIDMGGLTTQMTVVVKDLAELKADVNSRFDAHSRQHEQDRKNACPGAAG